MTPVVVNELENETEYSGSGMSGMYRNSEVIYETSRLPPSFVPIAPTNIGDTICGIPGICQSVAGKTCLNVTLEKCEDCPRSYLGIFLALAALLSAAILLGNYFVIQVFYTSRKRKELSNVDKFRASLAVADILTGDTAV